MNSRRPGAAQHRPSTWSANVVCASRCDGLPRRACATRSTEQATAAKRAEQTQNANKRAHPDLNQGPADLQSAALTTELCTHCGYFPPCRPGIRTRTHAELLVIFVAVFFVLCFELVLHHCVLARPCAFGRTVFLICCWPSQTTDTRQRKSISISGLVVEYIVAIDVTRVRFPADALLVLHRCVRCRRCL